jgi:hypothetical protein
MCLCSTGVTRNYNAFSPQSLIHQDNALISVTKLANKHTCRPPKRRFLNGEDGEFYFAISNVIPHYRVNEVPIEWTESGEERGPFHEERGMRKKNISKDQVPEALGALWTFCWLISSCFHFFYSLRGAKGIYTHLFQGAQKTKLVTIQYTGTVECWKSIRQIFDLGGKRHLQYWKQGTWNWFYRVCKKLGPYIIRLHLYFVGKRTVLTRQDNMGVTRYEWGKWEMYMTFWSENIKERDQ